MMARTVEATIQSEDEERNLGPLVYFPLYDPEAIRVLHLKPGQTQDPIICTLQVCSIDEHPPYHALSYTWGDANDIHYITCCNAALKITRNLDAALRHIRQPGSPTCLWIDAICINQDDIDERSRQVRIMKDVYAEADETICWLGEGNADSDMAIDLIARMANMVKIPGPGGELTFSNLSASHFPVDKHTWEVLSNFYYRRPWFRRVWVRQEVAVSNTLTIMCGENSLDWGTFSQVSLSLAINRSIPSSLVVDFENPPTTVDLSSLLMIRTCAEQLAKVNDRFELCALLLFCHDCEATLLVDRIYALLGLTADAETPELSPDYRLTVHHVYIQLAKCLLQRDNTELLGPLSVLYLAGLRRERKWALPTWVPQLEPLLHSPFGIGMQYAASGSTEVKLRFESDDADAVFVCGKVIDSLEILTTVVSALDSRGRLSISLSLHRGWVSAKQSRNSANHIPGKTYGKKHTGEPYQPI